MSKADTCVNQFTYLLNFWCLQLLPKRSDIRVGYCCARALIEPIYEGEDEPHATIGYEANLVDPEGAWLRLQYNSTGEVVDYRAIRLY
jgi:hypothetical protein